MLEFKKNSVLFDSKKAITKRLLFNKTEYVSEIFKWYWNFKICIYDLVELIIFHICKTYKVLWAMCNLVSAIETAVDKTQVTLEL